MPYHFDAPLPSATSALKQQVLSPARNVGESKAVKSMLEVADSSGSRDFGAANLNSANRPPNQKRMQMANEDFDFRQLGHEFNISPGLAGTMRIRAAG
jgi:hypothetical protein